MHSSILMLLIKPLDTSALYYAKISLGLHGTCWLLEMMYISNIFLALASLSVFLPTTKPCYFGLNCCCPLTHELPDFYIFSTFLAF